MFEVEFWVTFSWFGLFSEMGVFMGFCGFLVVLCVWDCRRAVLNRGFERVEGFCDVIRYEWRV